MTAVNYKLRDDFTANAGQVVPADKIVFNDDVAGDEKNPHKSFGYLRTREMAGIVRSFIEPGKSGPG